MADKPLASSKGPPAHSAPPQPWLEARALQTELNLAEKMISQLSRELEEMRRRARDGEKAKTTVRLLSRELHEQAATMQQQRDVARQFQRLFVPPAIPQYESVRFAVKYMPCDRVGGDFYDIFDMGNGCVGILLADISGYGLPATLVTTVAKIAFDTFRQNEYSPRAIMEKANRQILQNTLGNQFLTAFLGVLDLQTRRMKFVNASHPCPVVYSADRFELLDTDGLCCGMFENPRYEEKEVQLKPGERVMFYTRGLVASTNESGLPYEISRLYQFLRANPDQDIQAMVEHVSEDFTRHMGGAEQHDDLILITLEALPRVAKEECIVIPSEPMQLTRVESLILSRLQEANYGERAQFAVRLAVEEAVINAIKHGNHMDKAKKVAVTFSVDPSQLRVSVEDEGEGFNPDDVPDPTLDENLQQTYGRGLLLMRAYMDEVTFNEKGNCVTMRKRAPWAE